MKRSRPLALALLLLAGTAARAEPITWSYSWSSSPGVVSSDDGSLGKVTVQSLSGGPLTGSWNGIDAAHLTAMAPASGTATFTHQSYTLDLHLTDLTSHTSGDVTFTGALSGTLGKPSALTNTFAKPTQSITLGGTQYVVTVGLFIPPVPGTPGRIGSNVIVSRAGEPPPPVSDAPEPGTMLLAFFGGSALGLRCWWRRRRAAVPAPQPA
jgi:hypothetical protein